jgi:hypothetical protein
MLMRKWKIPGPSKNPPNEHGLPNKIPYIRHYVLDMACVAPPGPNVTLKQFRHRIYSVLLAMAKEEKGTSEIRIICKYPGLPWQPVWANIQAASLPDSVKSTWYDAIHDIIPTNERLAAILTPTTACSRCGETDTLLHRITRCEVGRMIWTWTRARIAEILLVQQQHISEEWTLRPIFHLWPPQRQAAIVWIVAHLVTYQLQTQRRLPLADYIDVLKRARWKEYHRKSKHPLVGRYLEVL